MIAQDVTDPRTEGALALLAALLDSAECAIMSLRPDGGIAGWSRGAQALYGYAAEEVLGRESSLLSPPDRADEDAELLDRLARGERIERIETVRVTKGGGRRDVSLSLTPVRDEAGAVALVAATAVDITARTRAEEQREDLRARAERVLEDRNQFLSIASHELKTPITLLKGYAQVLRRRTGDDADPGTLRKLEVMERQTDRMTRIIDDLLEVSRIEGDRLTYDMRPLELHALLAALAEEVRADNPRYILHLHATPPALRVYGDPERLRQVLLNLLSNAVRHSEERQEICLRSEPRDGSAEITVTDRGAGIPEEQRERVFDLYYRGAGSAGGDGGGLGVGLYISRAIVEHHGGAIGVDSAEGEGSSFRVTLPALGAPHDVAGARLTA